MLLDPQALAGLIAAVLFALSGKVYQLSTRQGRALRKSRRGNEYLENYIWLCRRIMNKGGIVPPEFPKELAYMNPSTGKDGDDDDA